MTVEHAAAIVRRYKEGRKWHRQYEENTFTAICKDYQRRLSTIRDIAEGRREDEDPEVTADIRHRHQLALEAEPRWRQDSIAQLKREYRMSTDTLMKMVDQAQDQDILSVTKKFLTGKL
jgi:hypothetical protein